ncbi:sensor histidine kinase [Clostridium arbusti]|uniref:sensor histidine kinase n=1 Tax=Clostridium arbusti TaxID=1137848 RepID=UPI001FB06A29|nr:sensor histidine kinase [Clostridium arbusti]
MSAEQRIYHDLLIKLYKDANEKVVAHNTKSIENLEFMTMWVHEIKTPIAASKLIIENSVNAPSEKVLYSIEDEINKIEDFVQMTLFYLRSDDFAKDYLIHSINLNTIINDCIIREYSSITNKNLSLNMDNLDLEIDTDEKWLGFIIKQILDNAIKYSSINSAIKIYAEQTEKESVLYIEDSGIGIKAEDINRVFDKSFTGNNGRKFYTSTGIGLYLSQKLARKLGYNISVSSEYGNGTKVSIHFPKWSDYFKMQC